jgi:drug/metabolite transporter (DMT)-like permease
MDWVTLTLLCAFTTATSDAITKRYFHLHSDRQMVIVRFGLTALLLTPLMLMHLPASLPPPFWGWLVAIVPFEILAMLLYMRAIRESPLALTLPYLSFTPVFSVLSGFLLLGETLAPRGLCGVLLVVTGAYLLNGQRLRDGSRRDWSAPLRAILRERGSRLMLMVSFLYSLTSAMGKGALQYAPPEFFGAFYLWVLTLVSLGVFYREIAGLPALILRQPKAHFSLALAMAIMVATHFAALEQVEVAYLIAVKRLSLLAGLVYGYFWFREADLIKNLAAGSIMVVGAALIVL